MRTPKQVILSALYSVRGDDLERARMAWGIFPMPSWIGNMVRAARQKGSFFANGRAIGRR